MPTFTSLPVVSFEESTLGEDGDDDAGAYSRTVVEWRGQNVAIYNVHLRSFNPLRPWDVRGIQRWIRAVERLGGDFMHRSMEAQRLRKQLDGEPLPFLVLGDLNSTPDQWAYAHVAKGLRDAIKSKAGWAATYPDRFPLVQIDVALASPEWAVAGASLGPRGLSDHRAVVGEVVLAQPARQREGTGQRYR